MKLMAFSIYDVKVEAYSAPFCCRTFGEAERFVTDILNDPQGQYSKHKEDYQLYCVGSFDQDSGILEPQKEITRLHGLEVSNG